jgi:hypothetical protein
MLSEQFELERRILVEVYGWKPCKVPPDAHGENECECLTHDGTIPTGFQWPRVGKVSLLYFMPGYTTTLQRAIDFANLAGATFDVGKIPTSPYEIAKAAWAKWSTSRRNDGQ